MLEAGIEPVLPRVVLLWLLGVSLMSIRTGREWYAIHTLLKDSVVCAEVQLQRALENIKSQLGVQKAVRFLVSTRVLVPLATGFLHPVILMPASVLARLPQGQLKVCLRRLPARPF